jgi:hypothetical protein
MTDLLFWQVYEKVVLAVSAVIPAKAGIQYFRAFLDSRLRGSDDWIAFFSNLLELTISFSPTCRARDIRMPGFCCNGIIIRTDIATDNS